jgi:hypothetical protein
MGRVMPRTVSEIIESSGLLPRSDRDAALAWATEFGEDVRGAIASCSCASRLALIARGLGEDRVVDRWYVTTTMTPEYIEEAKRLAALPREEQKAALMKAPLGPSEEVLDAAIEDLRSALDIDALALEASRSNPEETDAQREARIIDAALADCEALAEEGLDRRAYAARWGQIGGRTFARVSSEGAARFIQEARQHMKKEW